MVFSGVGYTMIKVHDSDRYREFGGREKAIPEKGDPFRKMATLHACTLIRPSFHNSKLCDN